jgi:hypothetical protein
MTYWKHSLLSQKKFGGDPLDYVAIHKFLDSSKLFMFHIKHRVLLHNTYGIELCMDLFGDVIINSEGKKVLTRDIAAEHCREDLRGSVPTLRDWLTNANEVEGLMNTTVICDDRLREFVMRPYIRTGLQCSLAITWSNFGLYLVERCLGASCAAIFAQHLGKPIDITEFLKLVPLNHGWQHCPNKEYIDLIKNLENEK